MDPNVVITNPMNYLMSVGGIVALTIGIVHIIKRDLGRVRYLQDVPTWVYAMLVSAGLTYTAHALLRTIEGDLTALIVQAALQALMASGAIETVRTWNKPISETSAAMDAQYDDRYRSGWPPGAALILFALVPLAAVGCGAKQLQVAVDVENAITITLARIDRVGDQVAGCVTPATAPQPEACQIFNRAMTPAATAARAFNRSVQRQDVAAVSDLVRALADLATAIDRVIPAADKDALLAELGGIIARVSTTAFGGQP